MSRILSEINGCLKAVIASMSTKWTFTVASVNLRGCRLANTSIRLDRMQLQKNLKLGL